MFRQIHPSCNQAVEPSCGIGQRDRNDSVFDFAAITVVLSPNANCDLTAHGRAGLVVAADGVRISELLGNKLLTLFN